ncbi:RNA-directed DNA polymerase [Flagellimonas taeanensis]|uniref:reverse transcriptase family protein n=1 Tax=Flavobacteriaceae TaxID=49546 RepID=UPI000E684073|nr:MULTISPECIES: reverse transcriptase family protein [Allomuricauda]MDC6385933.1 reverse transcriptase family protein [Muricauda sp. SK9]RIV50176.1 RNA-directed DNA polymerase [Allomuricauda taeanensis]
MNSLQFKKNEFKKLCALIGFKPALVSEIISNIDDYYYEKIEIKKNKKTGEVKKYKDGTVKKRTIHPSVKELKAIQKSIKKNILAPIPLPKEVHGGVKKRSNITNAKPHKGNKYIFTTDLQDFYPNISHNYVHETYLGLGFSNHFSNSLTKLTTWKYALPQGTPTSTHISNLVFLKTDYELIQLCNKNNITYTRYVDDLTFSSPFDFKHLLNDILDIIRKNNFKLSYRKTKYKGNQTITGINVFLNKIEAPEHIREKSKIELENNTEKKPYSIYLNNIQKENKLKVKKASR